MRNLLPTKMKFEIEQNINKILRQISHKLALCGIITPKKPMQKSPLMRTIRNYSGTQNSNKILSDLLPEIMTELGKKAQDPREEIFRYWYEIAGEKMGPLTEPVSFMDQVLTVKVKSSTVYSLLVAYERGRLLKQMQSRFTIRNLFFRVG